MTKDWNKLAASILKAELKRKSMTYEDLALLLEKIGVKETQASILNKLSRGTFQFAFFLQCAAVINLRVLQIDELIHD